MNSHVIATIGILQLAAGFCAFYSPSTSARVLRRLNSNNTRLDLPLIQLRESRASLRRVRFAGLTLMVFGALWLRVPQVLVGFRPGNIRVDDVAATIGGIYFLCMGLSLIVDPEWWNRRAEVRSGAQKAITQPLARLLGTILTIAAVGTLLQAEVGF